MPSATRPSPTVSTITTSPIADVLSRRRTYTIAQLRKDFRDAQAQYMMLLNQLHDEQFTGSMTFHLNKGSICSVEISQSYKLPTPTRAG